MDERIWDRRMSDLIKRKSIKNLLCDLHIDNISINDKNILEYFDELPTVDAKPVVHGEWIPQDMTYTRFMCSQRNSKNYAGHEKFCPECGADMRKGGAYNV